jgi:anti-sigma factor RsiW
MSEPVSEELLSAYVDGELSPQLRAAVERWVENSPEARQKLEDFQRLSRLFGDLPRIEVPGEFSTEVLHLAERRMLLPEATAASGRKRFRRLALTLAASITAAALLLILKISTFDDQANKGPAPMRGGAAVRPGSVDNRNRNGNGEQPNVLVAEGEPQSGDADRSIVVGAEGGLPPSAGTAGGSAGTASSSGAANAKVALAVPAGPMSPNTESEQLLQAINDAVQEIRESGAADKLLLVFRLSVIDRAEGLVLLQRDFAANNIRIDSGETTNGRAANGDKPVGEASNEGLYVVAQADELIAGFKTFLARRHPGVRIFVEQSIELAALDAESRKQFLAGDVEQSQDGLRRGDDAADKNSKADEADAKANKKSSPSLAQRKTAPSGSNSRANQPSESSNRRIEKSASVPRPNENDADAKGSSEAPEGKQLTSNARQMIVPVLPQAIQNRAQSNAASNSQAPINAARSQNQQNSVASNEAKKRDTKPLAPGNEKMDEPAPALVRMLIVIENEPQQPAAPSTKKGPSGGAS